MSNDQAQEVSSFSPEQTLSLAAVHGIELTSPFRLMPFSIVMSQDIPTSSRDGSFEVFYMNPFEEDRLIDQLSRFSIASVISGAFTISPLYADVNVAVRIVPSSLKGKLAVLGTRLFDDGFASVAYFGSKVTVPQAASFDLAFPPEPVSRLVHGMASLASPPGFLVGIKRESRGGATSTWEAFSLSIRFTFMCNVAGHGVLL